MKFALQNFILILTSPRRGTRAFGSLFLLSLALSTTTVLAQGRIEIPANREFAGPPFEALKLESPLLEPVVGHRPNRSSGLRIELESLGSNPVVHAYAHGGAGLSLAPGTADEAINQVADPIRENKKVIVVGGGVIGLSIAHRLREVGHRGRIEIYSANFFPHNVSRVAGGLWSPVSFSMSNDDPDIKNRLLRSSYQHYQRLVKVGWPVIPMPMFVTKEAQDKSGLEEFRQMQDVFQIESFSRLPIQGVSESGYGVQTFLIDTPHFMERLMKEVKTSPGVTVTKYKFESMDEVLDRAGEGSVIFNATGIGARELVDDQNIFPTRGDLIYVQSHAGFEKPFRQMGHMAFYGKEGTDYAFPRQNDLVIGGSFIEGDWSLEVRETTCAQKLASFNTFYGLKK